MIQTAEPIASIRGAQLWPMTVEAYHLLGEAGAIPENTELLYGLIYTKMPKSPLHSFILRRLLQWLNQFPLPGLFISTEQPLTIGHSEPEPDIALVKGTNEDFRQTHPTTAELVIEICVTSHEYDRSKLSAYARAQVKECWLILVPEKQVEVHSRPAEGQFALVAVHSTGTLLQSSAVPAVSIDLSELFAS